MKPLLKNKNMNIELDLLELNTLYVAVSNHVKKTQKDAENYPSDFFETQATLAELLAEKVQLALYETCEELDVNFVGCDDDDEGETLSVPNYTDEVYEETLGDLEAERIVLLGEMNHYANERDFRRANEISDRIDEIEEQIENLKK